MNSSLEPTPVLSNPPAEGRKPITFKTIDANEAALTAGVATGIQFSPVTPEALEDGLRRLVLLWRNQPVWQRMQRNAMSADVSWRGPAGHYSALYKSLLAERA